MALKAIVYVRTLWLLGFLSHFLACDLIGHTRHPVPLPGQHAFINTVAQYGFPCKVIAIKVMVYMFAEKMVEKMILLT